MVKRSPVGLLEIADFGNLAWAFWRAARGKRGVPEVERFAAHLEREISLMRDELLQGRVRVGRFRTFTIRDPKLRVIHAPVFRERVLHHALLRWVGPVLDRSLVDDTFACRPRKGNLAAVARVQEHARRYPWYVQVDVRRFFDSVAHQRLKGLLRRRLSNRPLLRLLDTLIDSYRTVPGRGLPIGALTSQHFGNFYLSPLDRFLSGQRTVLGIARYMDDAVWWCRSRGAARETLRAARRFVRDELALDLKPTAVVQRGHRGVSFCGFRATALQAGYPSALAVVRHADSLGWRRAELLRRGTVEA